MDPFVNSALQSVFTGATGSHSPVAHLFKAGPHLYEKAVASIPAVRQAVQTDQRIARTQVQNANAQQDGVPLEKSSGNEQSGGELPMQDALPPFANDKHGLAAIMEASMRMQRENAKAQVESQIELMPLIEEMMIRKGERDFQAALKSNMYKRIFDVPDKIAGAYMRAADAKQRAYEHSTALLPHLVQASSQYPLAVSSRSTPYFR